MKIPCAITKAQHRQTNRLVNLRKKKKKRPEGGVQEHFMVTGRKSLRSRGNSMCKGPEAAAVPEHVRSNKEVGVAGAQ